MSFKFNWGHGISIALALFVLFIGSFVYKTLVVAKYDHTLISEEYYKEELNYQNEIDRLNNAANLSQNVVINKTNKGIELVFPNTFDYTKIIAHLNLQRISNKELDFVKDIELEGLMYIIPDEHLVRGMYSLKLNWEYEEIPYQLKEKIRY